MFYFWLGDEAEYLDEYISAMLWERHETERYQQACKPEADGFITVHPKVKHGSALA